MASGAGNMAIQRLATDPAHSRSGPVLLQRKLTIGSVDDPLEQSDVDARNASSAKSEGSAPESAEGLAQAARFLYGWLDDDEGVPGAGRAHAPKPAAAPSARGAQSPLSTRFALGERTRQVVAPTADALGLGDDVPVHLDGEAAERTAARGAPALATEGAVYLDPARFDPDSRAGRYLVAHELVHVAQSRLGGSASVDDAEAEADAAARSYVGGAALERPRVPLAPHVRAAGPDDAETRAAPPVPRPLVIEASKVPEGNIATMYSFSVERFGREGVDRKRLRYVRTVRLHTADDLVVTLEVEGHVDFPLATPDADAKAMINSPGAGGSVRARVHAEVHRGPMIDWYGFDFADSGYGSGLSLREMAGQGVRCMHLGLSDRAQVDALLDEVRRRMPPKPKRANQPAPKRRPRPTPPPPEPEKEEPKKKPEDKKKKPSLDGMSESEFQQLSRDEKGELAREEILDSIDWGGIGWQLLIGLGLLLLAIGAIIAAVEGLAFLAAALVAAVVVAAIFGIIYLLRGEIADIIERIGESDVFGAILKFAAVVAVFLAIVIGVYVLVVAVGGALAGGAVALGGLAFLALGLLVAGIILKGVIAWHDYQGAKDAPDLQTFHKQTQRATHGVQGVITDILMTLMAIVGGKMAPSGGGKRPAPPPPDEPVVIEPPQVAPAAPPVPEVPQVAPPAPSVPEMPQVAGPTIMEPHVKTPTGPSPGRDPVVDLPPGVKIVKPKGSRTPRASRAPKGPKPPTRRDRVIAEARDRLGALEAEQKANKAHLDSLDKQIADAQRDVRVAKENVKSKTRGTKEHDDALKELKKAQDVLKDDEGSGLLDEQRGTVQERQKLRAREDKILESLKLKRPTLSQKIKDLVLGKAEKNADGKYLDANTGEVIDGDLAFGHKYGFEHRRLALQAAEKGMNQSEFNAWVNKEEHAEWFQVEKKANNESHRFEKPGID